MSRRPKLTRGQQVAKYRGNCPECHEMIEVDSIVWLAGSRGWVHAECKEPARARFREWFATPGNGDRFLEWVDAASSGQLDRMMTTYHDDLWRLGGIGLVDYVESAYMAGHKRERTKP
jgi:hypothetical protein